MLTESVSCWMGEGMVGNVKDLRRQLVLQDQKDGGSQLPYQACVAS